jgi:hypothetical protein
VLKSGDKTTRPRRQDTKKLLNALRNLGILAQYLSAIFKVFHPQEKWRLGNEWAPGLNGFVDKIQMGLTLKEIKIRGRNNFITLARDRSPR